MELQTKGYKVLLMFYILNDIYKTSIFFFAYVYIILQGGKNENRTKSNIK